MNDFLEIRNLFDVSDNSYGYSESQIVDSENYLGKRLPVILRQYFLQFGKNQEINQTQDNLVLPSELEVYEDGFVVIYSENQVVWQAGIKFSDFYQDNPNVYLSYDQQNWSFEIGDLYNFLIAESFLQALFALPFNANSCDVGSEKESFIRENWKESKFKSYLWGTEFFQNAENEILALMKNENQVDLFIATNSKERFIELNEKLQIDWDYNSLED